MFRQDKRHHCQPPLGGCVLKPLMLMRVIPRVLPAAFRRLCVETEKMPRAKRRWRQPPLGGCVLKRGNRQTDVRRIRQPPLGGCVLKPDVQPVQAVPVAPAAFRRLCVETLATI